MSLTNLLNELTFLYLPFIYSGLYMDIREEITFYPKKTRSLYEIKKRLKE